MSRIGLTLCAALLLAGCEEPVVVFAGGELSGTVVPAPDDWSAVDAIDTVQLETQPHDPYSINIWAAAVDRDLYVATGPDGTNWTQHIAADARVRLRAEGNIYELDAFLVRDEAERARVAQAYVRKYDVDEDDSFVTRGMIYRLDRR